MPLVSLKEVLDWAEAHNAAVPAFNIDNIDIAQSLMLAAEEEQKPVILAVGQGAIRVGRLDLLASVVKTLAARSALPVVLHLDHGASFEQTVACIRAGFTSVMFDGSSLPLRENIEQTRLVIKAAHAVWRRNWERFPGQRTGLSEMVLQRSVSRRWRHLSTASMWMPWRSPSAMRMVSISRSQSWTLNCCGAFGS